MIRKQRNLTDAKMFRRDKKVSMFFSFILKSGVVKTDTENDVNDDNLTNTR
jgi:hypothetical protein